MNLTAIYASNHAMQNHQQTDVEAGYIAETATDQQKGINRV